MNKDIVELADRLFDIAKDYMDALHISSACIGACDCFITCDDELTIKRTKIENLLKPLGFKIIIRNPVDFINESGEFL